MTVITEVLENGLSCALSGGAAPDAEAPDASGRRYTIDELAAATGVPSRTIRFYQAKGALAPPTRAGRQAFYGDAHVERLRLIAELQDRGLNLKAIRDLFSRADSGDVSVSEWLGIGDNLRAPWSDDAPRVMTEAELVELLGEKRRPGYIAELVRVGLVRREGNALPPSYFVESPELLRLNLKLDDAGVALEVAAKGEEILRRRIARAADELAAHFTEHGGLRDDPSPGDVARSLDALREVGADAVRLVFAQEMERALRTLVEEGRAVPPRRRRR